MIKVERYSISGFKTQKQIHHLQNFVYPHMYEWKEFYKEYPVLYRHLLLERHKKLLPFYKENFEDFTEGLWVFIAGHKNRQSLNHLKHKVPCWTAELPDDTIVYDVNWEEQLSLSDPINECFGCYVPKRSLKQIQNIERK